MSWGEIKNALNSTVGTDDFESLDKKIDRTNSALVFNNDFTYIESNDVLCTIYKDTTYISSNSTINFSNSYFCITSGNLKIKIKSAGDGSKTSTFEILKNNKVVGTIDFSSKTVTNYYNSISVEKGDVLTFSCSPYSSNCHFTIYEVSILGELNNYLPPIENAINKTVIRSDDILETFITSEIGGYSTSPVNITRNMILTNGGFYTINISAKTDGSMTIRMVVNGENKYYFYIENTSYVNRSLIYYFSAGTSLQITAATGSSNYGYYINYLSISGLPISSDISPIL